MPATPKLLWVAPSAVYEAAGGKRIAPGDVDLVARVLSMGELLHAMTGTGAVAIASAASVPRTMVSRIALAGGDARIRLGRARRGRAGAA